MTIFEGSICTGKSKTDCASLQSLPGKYEAFGDSVCGAVWLIEADDLQSALLYSSTRALVGIDSVKRNGGKCYDGSCSLLYCVYNLWPCALPWFSTLD